jgi:hypothetical protein
MKPTKTVKKGGLRKSNIDGVSLIKVHYVYVFKYHNETSVYN